jgi:hypothetical protein
MWKAVIGLKEHEFESFKEAAEFFLRAIKKRVDEGTSWHTLETCNWMETPTKGELSRGHYLHFYAVRDICADLGWSKEWGLFK